MCDVSEHFRYHERVTSPEALEAEFEGESGIFLSSRRILTPDAVDVTVRPNPLALRTEGLITARAISQEQGPRAGTLPLGPSARSEACGAARVVL